MAKNPVFRKRSKHIAIHVHFIHKKVEMELGFVRTLTMAVDQMTKYARVKVLEIGKELMGMTSGWNKLSRKYDEKL